MAQRRGCTAKVGRRTPRGNRVYSPPRQADSAVPIATRADLFVLPRGRNQTKLELRKIGEQLVEQFVGDMGQLHPQIEQHIAGLEYA